MVSLARNISLNEGVTIGLPPGLAGPPGFSGPPGLALATPLNKVDENSMLAAAFPIDPSWMNNYPPACGSQTIGVPDVSANHFINQDLSAMNARLVFENEVLKRQCIQKNMVEAYYGQAAHNIRMRAAAGAFPNPWYQMPMMGAVPAPAVNVPMNISKTRARTTSDLPAPSFPRGNEGGTRGRERTTTETFAMGVQSIPRVRADTDVHVVGKPQEIVEYTTLMLRNLPNNYTRTMLLGLLDSEGFSGHYDFVYLPIDFKSHASLGYAFVNLSTTEQAEACWKAFEGFNKWVVPSQKVCSVNWSTPFQGLESHVDRYRNSPVMHENVPDEYKPMLFTGTNRATFPSPTKKIRAPRIRPGRDEHEGGDSGSSSEQ